MVHEMIKKSSLKNTLIAVITLVYNVITYQDKRIASVLKQSQEGCELILIEDGSTDGSFEKIVAYGKI